MSTQEGEHSGLSLDVAEQRRSNPSPGPSGSAPQRGGKSRGGASSGRHDSAHSKQGSGPGNRGGGGTSKHNRGKKEGVTGHRPTTLIRTHSAPADEHAGIYEVGSNGMRTNQFQPYGNPPLNMMESRTSENSPSPQNYSTTLPNSSAGEGNAMYPRQDSVPRVTHQSSPVPASNPPYVKYPSHPLRSQDIAPQIPQPSHKKGQVSETPPGQSQQKRSSHQQGVRSDGYGTTPYDASGRNNTQPIQSHTQNAPSLSMNQSGPLHHGQFSSHPPYPPRQLNPQFINIHQTQQQGAIPVRLPQAELSNGQTFMYYSPQGNVPPVQISGQSHQQSMRQYPGGQKVDLKQTNTGNNKGSHNSPQQSYQRPGNSYQGMPIQQNPQLIQQSLAPLPPSHGLSDGSARTAALPPYGGYSSSIHHHGPQMYAQNSYGYGMSGQGPVQSSQYQPQVREKKQLVLKDKHGNVIDTSTFAKKSQGESSKGTTPSAEVKTTVVPDPVSSAEDKSNQQKEESLVIKSENCRAPPAQSKVSDSKVDDTIPDSTVQTEDKDTVTSSSIPVEVAVKSSASNAVSESNVKDSATATDSLSKSPALFGSAGVPSDAKAQIHDVKTVPSTVRGGLEIYDPLLEKEQEKGEKVQTDSNSPNDVKDKDTTSKTSAENELTSIKGEPKKSALTENSDNISVPHSQTSTSTPPQRNRKTNLKAKLAQADAMGSSSESGGVLDAYVQQEPVVNETKKEKEDASVPAKSEPSKNTEEEDSWETKAAKIEKEEEDSWEVHAAKIEKEQEEEAARKEKERVEKEKAQEKVPQPPVKRSLRPGGGVDKKSASGSSGKQQTNVIRYQYKKAEIRKMKPDRIERPPECAIYANLKSTDSRQGNWKGGQSAPQNQPQHQQGNSDAGWQRGQQQPPPAPGNRRNRAPPPPMVKKVITDPLEILNREVTDILNKIAPQTFKKLTQSLGEIQVHDSHMLETLVRLIFSKAITEPAYASLYADMCQTLDATNNYANFFVNVVFNEDTNQYFWIKDMQYTNLLAGPYKTAEDCKNAVLGSVPPPVKEVSHQVSLEKIVVVNGILISIIKSVDRDDFFVSFIPLADLDESMKSPQLYSTFEAARKSALKKNSFQKTLVVICQDEYQLSTSNQGIYGEPAARKAKLLQEKASMDPEEFEALMEEVEMLEMSVKKRMMGNIRFIGELCKRKMIRTQTMHQCIQNLLIVEDGKKVDGGNVELVCKLLTSVGQKLEQEATNRAEMEVIDSYFVKLSELRSSKNISSRIKFSIDEVIELRRNKWVARMEQDGPTTLSEIRNRVREDEEKKAMGKQQMHSGFHQYGGKSAGGKASRGSQDIRGGTSRGGQPMGRVVSAGPGGGAHLRGSKGVSESRGGDSGTQARGQAKGVSGGAVKPTASPEKKEASPEFLRKRTATVVDEFVDSGVEQEAIECLAELPQEACGYLISNLLDKYLNSIKPREHEAMRSLCKVLMPQLRESCLHVENSLKTYENLECLCDFMVDVKRAPELIGEVLHLLVQGGACRKEFLNKLLADLRQKNKEDEFGVPDSDLVAAHDSLRRKLN